jgi:hypothetical protein
MAETNWPALSPDAWKDTYATLHLWSQVVGKVALAQAPPLNHSWGIAFHLTPRGFSTLLLPYRERTFTMEFDFVGHELVVNASTGERRTLPLRPQTVADFYAAVMALLRDMGMPVKIWPVSVEMPAAVRIDRDTEHRSYDPDAANRFWRIVTSAARVLNEARCEFVGKSSPAHFFWGGFDLAWTRFSGRPAPPREGPAFMSEAYSHEVISHGFWPGSGLVQEAAFYSYAVPEPAGLKEARVRPDAAYYHREMGEFILPYEAVRTAASPERALREFVDSTYERAATLGNWDRAALERGSVNRQ